MFSTTAVSTDDAVAGVRSAIGDALGVEVCSPSSHDLLTLHAELEIELNRLAAAQRRVLAEIDSRGVAGEIGSRSTADVIADQLHISPFDARRRVDAARTFGQRRALTGEPLEPVVPLVAEQLEAGTISIDHANVIAKLLDDLPGDIEAVHGIAAQRFLLAQATQVDPPTLRKIAVRLRDTLDQDGAQDRIDQVNRNRSFTLVHHPDGSSTPRGTFTPALTTALKTVLDPLAAPRPSELGERDRRS